jgi:hypothetical protein
VQNYFIASARLRRTELTRNTLRGARKICRKNTRVENYRGCKKPYFIGCFQIF